MTPGRGRSVLAAPPLVAPFAGERYAGRRDVSAVISPPYDVIAPDERERLVARDPHNVVRLILPDGDGDRYERAGRLVTEWRDAGVLAGDPVPSVYVVRQEFALPDGERRVRTGVIGGVAVEPFDGGRVLPHERTHAEPKADRLALLRATGAMFEALLMLAPDGDGALRERLAAVVSARRPTAEAELDGVRVTLWRVGGRAALPLARAAGGDRLYVADGHHRYETAVAYRAEHAPADRLPVLVVPLGDPGLVVLPTHRVLYGPPVDVAEFVDALRERFQIREIPADADYLSVLGEMRERGTACVVVLPEARAVACLLKGQVSAGDLPFAAEPAVAALDVARIDGLVVRRLASHDEARVGYGADAGRVIDEVRTGGAAAGVLLNATRVEQVLAVADQGAAMPQKSTFFYPKVPSGLVVMRYG